MRKNYLFTSESVSEGHPDKVCDRISDAIVDAFLGADPLSRVAVETMTTTNRIALAGEVRGPDSVNAEKMIELARQAVKSIGYEQEGFHWKNAIVDCYVHKQSVDIAQGVDSAGDKDEGAGRPRDYVRLRVHGNRRADAGADSLFASYSPGPRCSST